MIIHLQIIQEQSKQRGKRYRQRKKDLGYSLISGLYIKADQESTRRIIDYQKEADKNAILDLLNYVSKKSTGIANEHATSDEQNDANQALVKQKVRVNSRK